MKIVEFKIYSDRCFEDCPLDAQNIIYKLLEKVKKEKNKIKVNKDKPIGKTIKNDALTLLSIKTVPDTDKSNFIIKIFDKGETHLNEGLNIEIGNENVRTKLTKIKT